MACISCGATIEHLQAAQAAPISSLVERHEAVELSAAKWDGARAPYQQLLAALHREIYDHSSTVRLFEANEQVKGWSGD